MGRLRGVLFDMDGVLVRSHDAWFGVVAEAAKLYRDRPLTRAEFDPTFGQGTRADVEVFGLRCAPEELDRFYVEHFHKYVDGLWVDPTARAVLEAVAARGLSRALVTNTVSGLVTQILSAAGLDGLFDAVVCADQVARPKPWPDLVHEALARLRIPAHEAIYLGDSRFDREATAAAGVRFVGLQLDGDHRIESLEALLGLLG